MATKQNKRKDTYGGGMAVFSNKKAATEEDLVVYMANMGFEYKEVSLLPSTQFFVQILNLPFTAAQTIASYCVQHYPHSMLKFTSYVGYDFSRVNLQGSDMSGCTLTKANFEFSIVEEVDFTGAVLTEA